MTVVFESIFPVFALVVLGFTLRKRNFVPAEHWRAIDELCFWLFFPALLISTLSGADLSSIELGAFSLTLLFTMASMACITLSLWPVLKKHWGTSGAQFSTIYQTTTRWHGFIALAIVFKMFGTEGATLIALAFAVMIPILQVTNVLVLAIFSSTQKLSVSNIVKTLLTNPIIWGVLVGIAINLNDINLWPPFVTILDLLGRAALGASLLALGAGLSLRAALKPSRELVVGLLGKLIVTPLLMMGWAIGFGVSGLSLSVLIICAAVPTAVNGYMMAKKMGGDAELYAATSSTQTALSFLTIPLFLWLGQTWAGGV